MHCSNAVTREVQAQTLLAPHKGMQRHRNRTSSTLREDAPRWCLPNDCSRSGGLQCTARYEDRILRAQPRRLRDRRDSFILSCLQGQHDNAATSACRSASTFPGLLSNGVPAPCAAPVPPMPPIPQPPAGFLHGWKRHSTGKPITDRHLFWAFCFKETWQQQCLLHQRKLWMLFMHMNKRRAEKLGSATNKCCKNAKDRST